MGYNAGCKHSGLPGLRILEQWNIAVNYKNIFFHVTYYSIWMNYFFTIEDFTFKVHLLVISSLLNF